MSTRHSSGQSACSAAGLVMAIVGGAIMPLVQGKLLDATSPAFSFIVPGFCFAVVGLYALYDLRAPPSVISGKAVGDAGPASFTGPAQPAEGAA
jgi:fucose permease